MAAQAEASIHRVTDMPRHLLGDGVAANDATAPGVLARTGRGREVAAGDVAALRGAVPTLEPARQLVPQVHGPVERVDIVGEGVAADGHDADHPHDPARAVLDLAEREAEEHDAGRERAAGQAGVRPCRPRTRRWRRGGPAPHRLRAAGRVEGRRGHSGSPSRRGGRAGWRWASPTRHPPPRARASPARTRPGTRSGAMRTTPTHGERDAGVAQDVPARDGAVAGVEGLEQGAALGHDDGYSGDVGIARVSEPEQHQRRRHPAALVPAVPDASGEPGGEPHEPRGVGPVGIQERLHDGGRAVAHPHQVRQAPVGAAPSGRRGEWSWPP